MNRNPYFGGVLVILIGVCLLMGKLGLFARMGGYVWPLFVLLPGAFLHFLFFTRGKGAHVLIPGGMLILYSLMFFYSAIFGWHTMSYLWPGFILGVAFGLFEAYIFDSSKPRGLLTASTTLAVISGVFFGFTLLLTSGVYVIAIMLIGIGIAMIYRTNR